MHRTPPSGAALLLALVAAGCGSTWRREAIYQARGVILYRERSVDPGRSLAHDHPATVDAEALEHLLATLTHEDKPMFGSPETVKVMSPREATRLAAPLGTALGAVGPEERVRFLVTRESAGDVFFGIEAVSGVAFVDDATLNLAFDAIGESISEGDGSAGDIAFPYDPTETRARFGVVPPFPGARRHRVGDGEANARWLEVELGALATAKAAAASAAEESASATEPETVASTPGSATKAPPPTTSPEQPSTAAKPAVAGAPEPARADESVRDDAGDLDALSKRLKALKKLREDGAITEDEYREAYDALMKGVLED